MSIAAMQWVMEHSEARLPERFVLLLIANEADELGFDGHPSQRRMAFLARDGQTQVRRWVDRLEGAGELLVKRPDKPAPGRFTRYVVVMGRDPVKLAEEVGWPAPRLDVETVAEWEQLSLETEASKARHLAAGYESLVYSIPVAPYPSELDAVENPGDGSVDNGGTAPNGPRTAPNRAANAGADPLTRAYAHTRDDAPPGSLARPTEEQAQAWLRRDAEQAQQATLSSAEVHELVARAKGQIVEVRVATETGEEPEAPESPPGGSEEAPESTPEPEDRWAARKDLDL